MVASIGFSSFASLLPKPKNEPSPATQKREESKLDLQSLSIQKFSSSQLAFANPITNASLGTSALVDYEKAIVTLAGHEKGRVIQTGLISALPKDLLIAQDSHQHQQQFMTFPKPPKHVIEAQLELTKTALETVLGGKLAATQPKNIIKPREAQFIEYVPSTEDTRDEASYESAKASAHQIIKVVEVQRDPLAPPSFAHKRVPRPPPSPPAPVLHSPPRSKPTHEQQQAWRIPPCVSNWKNPHGYTIPLDKRLAADGRDLVTVHVNDRFSSFAEALYVAEQHAKDEVTQRNLVEAQQVAQAQEQEMAQLYALARELVAKFEQEQHGRSRRTEYRRLDTQGRPGQCWFIGGREREVSDLITFSQKSETGESERNQRDPTYALYDTRLFDRTGGLSSGYAQAEDIDDDDVRNQVMYDRPLFSDKSRTTLDVYHKPSTRASLLHKKKTTTKPEGEGDEGEQGHAILTKRGVGSQEGVTAHRQEGLIMFERESKKRSRTEASEQTDQGQQDQRSNDPYGVNEFLSRARHNQNQ